MTHFPNGPFLSHRLRHHWPDIAIILLVTILPVLFFWRLIAPKPEDRLGIIEGDFTEQYFPLRAFSAAEWVNGRVPLWNPALFGGQPALADPQSGALYPPHVIQALLLGWRGLGFPLWALEQQVILHLVLAGVGGYLLGRYRAIRVGASRKTARFMGLILSITFTYSGYLTGFPVQQITILQASAWLPWVIWAQSHTLDAVFDKAKLGLIWGRAAWAALFFALAILAGHPQTVLYIFYLALAYLLLRLFNQTRSSSARRDRSVLILAGSSWLVSVVLGVLVAAAQLWPTLEFISHSLRADLSFAAVSQGLPLSELVTILYPGFFGGSPAYVGIVPLVLIAVALTLTPTQQRPTVLFWLGIALLTLVLAFGRHTFLYSIFYLAAPGFDVVRQQERAFLLFSFAAATLAGYGALFLSQPLPPAVRRAWPIFQRNLYRVGGAALLLTGLFIYGATGSSERGDEVNLFFGVLRHHLFGLILFGGALLLLAMRPRQIWRRWWGMGLIAAWILFNLFTVNWRFNLALKSEPPPFTPMTVSQFLIEHTAQIDQPVRIASGGLLVGGNNAASVYQLEDVTGNTPLQLANVAAFAEQMPAWRYWQLMNVRYVVDNRDIDGPGLARRYEAEGIQVFEVSDPFPRAWLLHQVIYDDDWTVLGLDETDLTQTALLPPGVEAPLISGVDPAPASVTEYHPGYLVISVEAAADGLLVVSNIDYPGWQAELDGQQARIYRTNGIFQGVGVSEGSHTVHLSYRPDSFRWGSWLSIIGLAITLGMIIVAGFRRDRE